MSSDLAYSLSETVQRLLSEPQASLLSGILFGNQGNFPASLLSDLKTTGTLHVVAVSGQNMSILAGMLGKITGFLGWRFSIILQGAGIIGYIFLVGGGASVVRSGLMALIALFAKATGRQGDAGRALAAAVILMLLVHADFLTDIGWQLSVLATAGIICLEPIISGKLKRWPKFLSSSFSVSLAAQAFTWPIITYNFGNFSPVSLPANVLIEWTVPWIMVLGAMAVLAGQVFIIFGEVIAWLAWIPLTYFLTVIEVLSRVPLASFSWSGFPLGLAVAYYTLLFWGTWRWSRKNYS